MPSRGVGNWYKILRVLCYWLVGGGSPPNLCKASSLSVGFSLNCDLVYLQVSAGGKCAVIVSMMIDGGWIGYFAPHIIVTRE